MTDWKRGLFRSRTRVYSALVGALLLSGLDLELVWDSFLGKFEPQRLALVLVACGVLATVLIRWLHGQFQERRAKRRFLLPFVIGFALLPLAGIGADELGTAIENGFQAAGLLIMGFFAFLGACFIGASFCAWVLVLVHYVRLTERTDARDGPQLVCAAIAGGLLGVSGLYSALHLLLLAFAGRPPDLIGQIVVWVIWAAVWFLALVWLAIIARTRNAKEEWLERVKKGEVPEYEIEPLSEHPEWAQLSPYFTARTYSGVLVYKPDDEREHRVPRGLVA